MQFVKGEAAIRHKEYLIISDLHIGWSKALYERGYVVPNEVNEFEKRIKKIRTIITLFVLRVNFFFNYRFCYFFLPV